MGRVNLLNFFEVPVGALDFRDATEDNDGTRLLATLQIGSALFHVMAYLAVTDTEGVQQFTGCWGEEADEVSAAIGMHSAWQTVEINGREYVLIITPHGT